MVRDRTVIKTCGGPPSGQLRKMMIVAAGIPSGEVAWGASEGVVMQGVMARKCRIAKRAYQACRDILQFGEELIGINHLRC
jgi:hypothetical protein